MAFDAAAEKSLAAERIGAPVRIGVVALLVLHLAVAPPPGTLPWLAWGILGVSALYAVGVVLRAPTPAAALARSRVTTVLDAGLIALFLAATGAGSSPYFLLWYVSITGVAFRYDLRWTVAAVAGYAALYLALVALVPAAVAPAEVALRLGFLVLLGVLGGLFAQEAYRQTADRLRALEDLRQAHERLQRLDGLKTQFLNNAAHELNTPLTSLRLQLSLLRSRQGQPPVAGSLDLLERSADRLELLAGDLLDVARLEAGRLRLDRGTVELGPLLEEAAMRAAPAAERAGIGLEVASPGGLWVDADPRRLGQVLRNLLDNALKFTAHGGRITLTAEARPPWAVVRLQDNGIGIPSEDLPRLFQPFSQLDTEGAGSRPGSGLRLSIARGIAEQHGGALWAESDGPEEGTTFVLTLPLAPTPALWHRAPRTAPPPR